jgi:hypothetical protein
LRGAQKTLKAGFCFVIGWTWIQERRLLNAKNGNSLVAFWMNPINCHSVQMIELQSCPSLRVFFSLSVYRWSAAKLLDSKAENSTASASG